jgi:peptide/nickel transport system permease protein
LKKILRYILALFFILSFNFLLPRIMPGDPITNLLGEDYIISPEKIEELKAELGLDKPLFSQYLDYWSDLIQLNLGYSYHFHDKVSRVILARAGWTLLLVGIAVLLASLAGTVLGALSAWAGKNWKNRAATALFMAVYCTPPFFLSLLLLYFFSFRLGIFPLKGFYDAGNWGDILQHLALPVLGLTLFLTSRNYMVMRGSVLQEKGKHYVLHARAKGLSGKGILFRHVLKNASLPILTLVALDFGFIFSGALFVEIVFSLNGMGTLLFDALLSRDYPVLQGVFLVITVLVIAFNFIVDILYSHIDPRVKWRET